MTKFETGWGMGYRTAVYSVKLLKMLSAAKRAYQPDARLIARLTAIMSNA